MEVVVLKLKLVVVLFVAVFSHAVVSRLGGKGKLQYQRTRWTGGCNLWVECFVASVCV